MTTEELRAAAIAESLKPENLNKWCVMYYSRGKLHVFTNMSARQARYATRYNDAVRTKNGKVYGDKQP